MGLRMNKQELENLYQFYSCEQIGKQIGKSAEFVRRKLHEFGIEIRKVGGRRSFDPPKRVLEALYQEMPMAKMADHFKVGETVVFKRLKEHGIELTEHKNHRLKPGRKFSEAHVEKLREVGRARAQLGASNPNWRGGLTDINRKIRGGWQYREWKKNSLKRANYCCEDCGVKDGSLCECCGTKIKLHAHHIKSFAKYAELRFDPQNSEVLCPKCHRIRHQ